MIGVKRSKFWNSTFQLILFSLFSFTIGLCMGNILHRWGIQFKVVIVAAFMILYGMLIMLYYNYQMARVMIKPDKKKRKLTYWYWAVLLVVFSLYYIDQHSFLSATYEMNKLGICQEQYIFLVNFLIFFIMGIIIHAIVFQQYTVKNISKDGIELEKSVEVKALENNTNIISKIGAQLGALDEVVNALYHRGYVTRDLRFEEYIDLLERVLYPISEKQDGVFIQTFSLDRYTQFMLIEKGYSTGMVKKSFLNFKDCGIISVEDAIHIKYKLSGFQNYDHNEVYVVVQLGTLFDIKIGELIYGYIKCFEALYSKYIDD